MDRLTSQQAGNAATAKWANEVVDELRRLNIVPGNGIKKTVTSSGTVLTLDIPAEGGGGGDPALDSCFPVYITSYTEGAIFKGMKIRIVDSGSGTSNEELYFPHVTPYTKVPVGTCVLAHRISAPSIVTSNG